MNVLKLILTNAILKTLLTLYMCILVLKIYDYLYNVQSKYNYLYVYSLHVCEYNFRCKFYLFFEYAN